MLQALSNKTESCGESYFCLSACQPHRASLESVSRNMGRRVEKEQYFRGVGGGPVRGDSARPLNEEEQEGKQPRKKSGIIGEKYEE
jgi:hypothetical protein